MDKIGMIIYVLLISGIIIADTIYLIIWIAKLFICRNIEECKNRKCHVKNNCHKYSIIPTPEEYERIHKLIDELDD